MSALPVPVQPNPQKSGNSRADLRTRFKPGNCANPGGRPKGETVLTEVRHQLNLRNGADRKAVAKAFIEQMKKGSAPHVLAFIEREEGKVPHTVNVRNETSLKRAVMAQLMANPEAWAAAKVLCEIVDAQQALEPVEGEIVPQAQSNASQSVSVEGTVE